MSTHVCGKPLGQRETCPPETTISNSTVRWMPGMLDIAKTGPHLDLSLIRGFLSQGQGELGGAGFVDVVDSLGLAITL